MVQEHEVDLKDSAARTRRTPTMRRRMHKPSLLFLILTSVPCVLGQLSLPDPPWLPPNASFGAEPSSGVQPNPHWSTLLGELIYFYEEQRSGKLPSTNRVPWRNDSALDDGKDVGLDLAGGYYDAGDYVKYTYPMSFTVMSACWGALDYGKGYDLANQTAYLDDMLRWGLGWLIKAHPSPNTLYVQVGDTDLDNAYWGGDRGIPIPRPSYPINATSPGTDAAAQAAAAFAACSALYGNRTLGISSSASLTDNSYATTLLGHAQDLYNFAINSSIQARTYQTSVPSAGTAYGSSSYEDEVAIAALFLSLAANSTDAYAQGVQTYTQRSLATRMQQDAVFNWDEKTPGVVVLGAQIAATHPEIAGQQAHDWVGDAEAFFDHMVKGTGRGYTTQGGLLWYSGDSDDASLNPALNAAMLLMRFADAGLTTTSDRGASYIQFAQQQLDYAVGKNPMTISYVVGTHPNAPVNPHSALSTGASPEDINNIDSVPEHEAYILYGGLVGGPDPNDRFWDMRSDWVQNEVGLDYVAPLLTLSARALVNGTGDPWYTRLDVGSYDANRPNGYPCDDAVNAGCPKKGWRAGKIALGVVVGVVGVAVLVLGAYWFMLRRRRHKWSVYERTGLL